MTLTSAQKTALKRADDLITNARTDLAGVFDELSPNDAWEALDGILDDMDELAWQLTKLFSDSKEA